MKSTEQIAIKFFDKELFVKKYSCSLDNKHPEEIKPYVNLYLNITDKCQANCKFCEFHKSTKRKFSVEKLKSVISELKNKNILINKVNFSGGEPTLEMNIIKEVLSILDPSIYTTINTNGRNLKELSKSILLNRINCISLSRHHWRDKENREIFQTQDVASWKDIKLFSDKSKLHLRCNLIKEYIDDQMSMRKYIEEIAGVGVYDFGFVSLMKINNYCKENFIDYSEFKFDRDFRTRKLYCQERKGVCNCTNFLHYTGDGNIVKLYSRVNDKIDFNASTLVIDLDVVRQGFDGPVLL